MTLAEIRELLAFKDKPSKDCTWINTLVKNHINNVEEQIASLELLKEQLEQLQHKCSGGKRSECGILASLSGGDACPYCEDLRCRQEQEQRPQSKRGKGTAIARHIGNITPNSKGIGAAKKKGQRLR